VLSTEDPTKVENAGIVWDPESGPGERYVKMHPVPFGEFLPFRDQLTPFIGRFDRVPRDFVRGTEPGVLTIGGVVVGDAICFEVAYDDVFTSVIAGGAEVITVQTNNATYQGTGQPVQQWDIERLRALNTGRAVVVASTSGISGFIAPDGTVQRQLGEGETGYLVSEVPLSTSRTPASMLPVPDCSSAWPLVSMCVDAAPHWSAVPRGRSAFRRGVARSGDVCVSCGRVTLGECPSPPTHRMISGAFLSSSRRTTNESPYRRSRPAFERASPSHTS